MGKAQGINELKLYWRQAPKPCWSHFVPEGWKCCLTACPAFFTMPLKYLFVKLKVFLKFFFFQMLEVQWKQTWSDSFKNIDCHDVRLGIVISKLHLGHQRLFMELNSGPPQGSRGVMYPLYPPLCTGHVTSSLLLLPWDPFSVIPVPHCLFGSPELHSQWSSLNLVWPVVS